MGGYQMNEGPITLVAATAIAPHLRVALDSNGQAAIAGASEVGIGTALTRAVNAGDTISVQLMNHGTHRMVASEAIAAINSTLYAAAGGKVSDTAGTVKIGVNKETATGDGSELEVIPIVQS